MQVKLFVGNLSNTTTEAELRSMFASAGGVDSVELIKDRVTGQAKNFGFVTMSSEAAAQKAIGLLNASALGNRKLTVSLARAKEKEAQFQPQPGAYVSKLGGFTLRDPGAKTNGGGWRKSQPSTGYQSKLGAFGGVPARGQNQRGRKGS
jgi:cold-inducible RNA-binding protein